jgi:hypothetical protein
MLLHEIHDSSNKVVMNLLEEFFSKITDTNIIKNYHPDYKNDTANIFYILNDSKGRYKKGGYYILEDDGELVVAAGYNEYEFDPNIMLALTRAYINPKNRTNYAMGTYILPKIIEQCSHYPHVYITVNEHNRAFYNWFVRYHSNKRPTLFGEWPDSYKQFKPIGKKTIYFTEQYVVELEK